MHFYILSVAAHGIFQDFLGADRAENLSHLWVERKKIIDLTFFQRGTFLHISIRSPFGFPERDVPPSPPPHKPPIAWSINVLQVQGVPKTSSLEGDLVNFRENYEWYED